MKVLRFESGGFVIEVFGRTEAECIERLGRVLTGRCANYAGEWTWRYEERTEEG